MLPFKRFVITFLAVTGALMIATSFFGVGFGHANFWDFHGVLFLIFISFFPRLTLFFSTVPFGGLLWWLGLIFAPRILVAVLATMTYWNQNPLLVLIAWLVAFGGETSEKYMVVRRTRPRGYESAKWVDEKSE